MAKKIVGTPFYELKIANPNAIANYNGGQLVKSIGDDMSKFVGKPTQGLIVKESLAAKIVEKVKKDLVAKKVAEPVLRAGISGKDVVFVVADLKNSNYEDSCVLVADYTTLREKLKKQAAEVVNLDPKDDIINDAARDMAANNNTTAKTKEQVQYGLITGNRPIILLAHGDEDKTSTGQIYGKDFADRTPEQLVAMLVENPDPKRALARDYAGTIYLDGCFTAQGSAMENYTRQVWKLLKERGLAKVTVKGNLGLAATTSSGDEIITTSEAKAQAKKLMDEAEDRRTKIIAKREELLDQIWDAEFKTSGRGAQRRFDRDARVIKINENAKKASDNNRTQLEKDLGKIPGYRVPNLVGQFGLPVLNPRAE